MKICFITGTRADYGILSPLMKKVKELPDVTLSIIATNMHLSPEYGMTVNEITADGFSIDERIESLLSADTPSATVKSMGLTQIGLADAFSRLLPDLVVILGDRYEMLAAASAAHIFRIPIAHLYGGETTEGAYDDAIRHAITQLATLHFTSTPQYARRVISMGANPQNVHWVGSLAAEAIADTDFLSLTELEKALDFNLGERYVVATFHPVTTMPGDEARQTRELLCSLDDIIADGWKVLFTMPNSDTGGNTVAHIIKEWAAHHPNDVKTVASLGRLRYYSALHHAAAAVGNSSSGLIEAPSFGIPTLNIGTRQQGRAQGDSVVNADADRASISEGLRKVLSPEFREKARSASNPYARPDTLNLILRELMKR